MVDRLAADDRLSLSAAEINAILSDTDCFVGAALTQVNTFAETVRATTRQVKGASSLKPGKTPLRFHSSLPPAETPPHFLPSRS